MADKVQFVLNKEQVDFLRKKYVDVPVVQSVLRSENDLHFEVSEDDDIDFFLWLDTESVATMDDDYEPTEDTRMLEGIIDYMHYQEEQ